MLIVIEIEIEIFGIVGCLDRLDGIRRMPSCLRVILTLAHRVQKTARGLTDTTHDVHTSSRTQAGF
jgi:hypothetical protein